MQQHHHTMSTRRPLRSARGFTLPEVVIALGVFLLLSAAVVSVYLMSLRSWREGSAQVSLQRKLAAAMQRMVQGERGRSESRQHGLREANSVTIIDPQTIEFTSGVDGVTRRVYLHGNELTYDPDAGSNDNVEETIYDPSSSEQYWDSSVYRTDLEFTQMSDGTIKIRLVGQERVRDRWMSATLLTQVMPRN